jgi:exodeoxyribonuclease VII large subunit
LAVLARGYAVTFRLPEKKIVRRASEVKPGDEVLIQLGQGFLECTVQKAEEGEPGLG